MLKQKISLLCLFVLLLFSINTAAAFQYAILYSDNTSGGWELNAYVTLASAPNATPTADVYPSDAGGTAIAHASLLSIGNNEYWGLLTNDPGSMNGKHVRFLADGQTVSSDIAAGSIVQVPLCENLEKSGGSDINPIIKWHSDYGNTNYFRVRVYQSSDMITALVDQKVYPETGVTDHVFDFNTVNFLFEPGTAYVIRVELRYTLMFSNPSGSNIEGVSWTGISNRSKTELSYTYEALQGFDKAYYLQTKLTALKATDPSWTDKSTTDLDLYLKDQNFTAESHYSQWGYLEGLGPNEYFSPLEYKTAKARAMMNSGGYDTEAKALAAFDAAWAGDTYLHYLVYGAAEGLNPSNGFDESSYLTDKLTAIQNTGSWLGKTVDDLRTYLSSVGMTALGHYLLYGKAEGLSVLPVPADERVLY